MKLFFLLLFPLQLFAYNYNFHYNNYGEKVYDVNQTLTKTYYEFSYSLFTYHWSTMGADRFANKATKDGRGIRNKVLYFSKLNLHDDNSYDNYTIIAGEDSIGSDIVGYIKTNGVRYGFLELGWVYGFYLYKQENWDLRYSNCQVRTPSYFQYMTGIPAQIVLGFELNFVIPLGNHIYIKQRNFLSPVITNHSIGLGVSF